MTGQPIETPDTPAGTAGGEQRTGVPVYDTAYNYGTTPGNGKSGKKLPVLIAVIVALIAAAVGCIVFLLVNSGVFAGNANEKVLAAFENTVTPGELYETLKFTNLTEDGEYTVYADFNVEEFESYGTDYSGIGVEMAMSADVNNGMYGIDGHLIYPDYNLDLSGEIYLDRTELVAAFPQLTDYMFVYNFMEEKTGYLVEAMAGEDFTLEQIDGIFKFLTTRELKDRKAQRTEVLAKLDECLKQWEFKSGRSAEYEVNGEMRKCKGYTVTITEEMLLEIVNIFEGVYDEYYEEQMAQMEELAELLGDEFQMDEEEVYPPDQFDEIKSSLEGMPDVKTSVYVYDNQVAAVLMDDNDGSMVELYITGGDYALQNWKLAMKDGRDSYGIEKTGSRSGDVEHGELVIENEDAMIKWDYNKTSGAIGGEISVEGADLSFEGSVNNTGNDFEFVFDRLAVSSYGDEIVLSGSVTVSDTATILKPSYTEFDLGNADRDEWETMIYDIYANIFRLSMGMN